ncbi:MAG: ferredoxin/flavodoxin---NADP+ reductase [Frankiaceae bacterium]|jgi:ferredoxin--NADP+ reductase|nr:ferredoxin/flavodoxin---NADP+ reductase [Frankiaceae bacterium]
MMRVVIVGSGPAGIYAAAALVKAGGAEVDVLDRLPCPFGLVRYGVAPDHPKIKSIAAALHKVLDDPAVRFLGNVAVGTDVSVAELHQHYDAVVFANGAAIDRRLAIPGEDLHGSISATDFVNWYNGHPDAPIDRYTLDAHTVAVIGVGNVAVDVARVLAKTSEELRITDVPGHVLDVLAASAIADIHVLGRRGPVQAKWTTHELRELGELVNADIVVRRDELVLDEASTAHLAADAGARRNFDALQAWAERPLEGKARRVHLRFLLRPAELLGADRVEGVRLVRTELDGTGAARDTADECVLDAQLVVRSVGYRGVAIPGLPFDERAGVIPNAEGRVLRDGVPVPGEYVAGWIKRGPTGVVGTNKHDANETVESLLHDELPVAPVRDAGALPALLAARGVTTVTWQGWASIEQAERDLGAASGRDREKIADRQALLRAAGAG